MNDLPSEMGRPARRALLAAGYRRLEWLTKLSEDDVERLHGVGPKALDRLRRALDDNGLSFADGKGSATTTEPRKEHE
jgi:hypothetical protein